MDRLVVMTDMRAYFEQKTYRELAYIVRTIYWNILNGNPFRFCIFIIHNVIPCRQNGDGFKIRAFIYS